MRAKNCIILLVFLFVFSVIGLVNAQGEVNRWIDDFNYQDLQQLQNAGWSVAHSAGASTESGSIILDGTETNTVADYQNHFPFVVSSWKIESKGAWMGQGHSVLSVKAFTDRHSYVWFVDGYYDQFAFYRDDKQIIRFGVYTETPNSWVTLSIIKNDNSVSLYYNGHLEYTYSEPDGNSSILKGVELISPWRGNAKYDYIMAGDPTATYAPAGTVPPTTSSESGFPTSIILIGGGLAAAVIGGIIVYYFFISGGSAAPGGASAGGTVGSTVTTNPITPASENSVIQEHPTSPLDGETPVGTMLSQGAIIGEHLSNLGQIINTLQNDFRTGLFGQHDPHFINGHVVDINQTINQLLSSVPQPITLDNLQAVLENSGSSADSVGSGLSSGASTGEMNATLPEYSVTNQIPGNTIFNALLEKLNSQGQQLFNDVQTQSIINQNRMDQYKEQFTNVIDSINNILRTQHDGGQQAITNMKSR